MATTKQNVVDVAKLTAEFPKNLIKRKPGAGNKRYVDAYVVIHRLNEATGYNWEFRVVSLEFRKEWATVKGGRKDAMTALVEMELPGMGKRQHIGVQVMEEGAGEDVAAKGAITDGLKKVASLFGVGTELYTDAVEEWEDKERAAPGAPQAPAQQNGTAPPSNGAASNGAEKMGGFNNAGEFTDAMNTTFEEEERRQEEEKKKQVQEKNAERPYAPHVLAARAKARLEMKEEYKTPATDEEKAVLRSSMERVSPDTDRRSSLLFYLFGIRDAERATKGMVSWVAKWMEPSETGLSSVGMAEAALIWDGIDKAIASMAR
jgi:hypothetical protein